MSKSLLHLSQTQLNLLETCPPQFQRVYLEQLASPSSPEQQEKLAWGSRFHLLMQQRELGLAIDSLLAEDSELAHSIRALINAVPEISHPDFNIFREAEHHRTLEFNHYLLTVVYDLLVIRQEQAHILDWKTYLQPENKLKLAKNWQTKLYLYVLAETSDYLPEQMKMTYWFVKLPTQPQSVTFAYSRQQHEQTKQELSKLLTQLDRWLEDYEQPGKSFYHLGNSEPSCTYCQANLKSTNLKQDFLTSIAEVEEVTI